MNTEGKTKGELLAMAEALEEARGRTYVSPVMRARLTRQIKELRAAAEAMPARKPVVSVSVQRYKGHNGYENCDWEWNVDIPPDGNYVLYAAPPDLAARVARLEDALRGMLELAEYWFMRENRRGYSEEQYKAWYSLGFDSNEFKNARAALANGE